MTEDAPADEHANDHADCAPDDCFTAKLRYWREAKHNPTIIPPNFKAAQ